MTKETIKLGESNNGDVDYPKDQKIKFENTSNTKTVLATPKGIKRKGKKDKTRKTIIEPHRRSGTFKVTGKQGKKLTYSWTVPDSKIQAMRTGRIKVS